MRARRSFRPTLEGLDSRLLLTAIDCLVNIDPAIPTPPTLGGEVPPPPPPPPSPSGGLPLPILGGGNG